MESFLKLDETKQKNIRDSGFYCFSINGYKKTSIQEVAERGGISKALIFHYFGSKKQYYNYLLNYSFEIVLDSIEASDLSDDFYEKMIDAGKKKIQLFKKEPYIGEFLIKVISDKNNETENEINIFLEKSYKYSEDFMLDKINLTKFKDEVDVQLIYKMVMILGESFKNVKIDEIDNKFSDFKKFIEIIKSATYKEEYL